MVSMIPSSTMHACTRNLIWILPVFRVYFDTNNLDHVTSSECRAFWVSDSNGYL